MDKPSNTTESASATPFYIRRVTSLPEYQACQQIQREAWGIGPEGGVLYLPLMVAIQKNGGLVLGAFEPLGDGSEKLIGFVLGFVGRDDATRRYFHYSQIAGTLPQWQSTGVGFALKLAQRTEAMRQGYDLMRWTYDPLLGRNAYFNLVKLGAVSRQYLTNLYGPASNQLYGQLDTDRLLVDWELDSARVAERIAPVEQNAKPETLTQEYANLPALVKVEWLAASMPMVKEVKLDYTEPVLKLEIPADINRVRQHAASAATNWREQTRLLFTHYLAHDYYVADFLTWAGETGRQSAYILKKA